MTNEMGTMTEYERQFYQQNLQQSQQTNKKIQEINKRSRLKKSLSECENSENFNQCVETNFLSPSKRKKKPNIIKSDSVHRNNIGTTNTTPSSTAATPRKINVAENLDNEEYKKYNSFRVKNKSILNLEQIKTHYGLEPNQNHNLNLVGDNSVKFSDEISQIPTSFQNNENRNFYCNTNDCSSESGKSRLINSTSKEDVQKEWNSLRRSTGRSTQSLCSCDADTEVVPDPMRPLYQYSLDRKKPLHTYTCEQNAQILLRLERERHKKYASSGKLNTAKESIIETPTIMLQRPILFTENQIIEDDLTDVDFIPAPPPPLSRNPSLTHHYSRRTLLNNKINTAKLNDCTATILNCANNGFAINNNELKTNKPDLCEINNKAEDEKIRNYKAGLIKEGSTAPEISIVPNGYCKQQFQQFYPGDENYFQCAKNKENSTFFLYHHEPPQYVPNFETQNFPAKFNTIGPSKCRDKSPHLNNKYHTSQCDLNQFDSNNLLNGRYFSSSLNNFPHSHYNSTPYTQFNGVGGSTVIGDSFASMTTAGTPNKQQTGMPWKHRPCPSRGSSSSGTSSTRWDMPSRNWLAVTSILLIAGAAGVAVPLALRVAAGAPLEERVLAAEDLLTRVPLIDGHNDLPWNIRKFMHNQLNDFHFDEDLTKIKPWAKSSWSHTDLPRLQKGRLSAQFWAAYVPCEAQHKDAVQLTLEQIDVIKRLTDRYAPQLTTCVSSKDIIEAHKNHQLCSLTGVEGGHSLGGSLGVLRTLYTIGVRYMTLTSTCHTPWADSSHADAPKFDVKHGGLTSFGKTIIREMNRLGMIVDLSHVSVGTMRDALSTSEAPVIFSHSSAYELCNSSRNVQDDILIMLAKNGGLVMVNFYSRFLSCSENATVHDAVAHINHIKRVAGIDHVGLGAGFDGINYTPKGLEDVSTYPMLFAELLGDDWTLEELSKLAGQNFIRVMQQVESVRDAQKLAGVKPFEEVPNFRSEDPYNCTTS